MITKDKVIEIFCIIDEFDKNLNVELSKNLCLPSYNGNGKRCWNRRGRLSESEIMTILVCYHFGTYRNFKEYYQNCIRGRLRHDFPAAVSYNRFVELMPRVFFKMMLFMKLHAFGKCTGIPRPLQNLPPSQFSPYTLRRMNTFDQKMPLEVIFE